MLGLIRRIQLILAFFTILSCGLFFYAYTFYEENQMLESEQNIHYAFKEKLENPQFNKATHHYLQKLRIQSSSEKRSEIMSNYIQAYANKNYPLIEKRKKQWMNFEKLYLSKIKIRKSETDKNVVSLFILGMITSILNLFFFMTLLNKQVLHPVRTLSKQINDFMDGYYTYTFSDPPDNELGNLERSFHQMAEKVIKNMDELKELDQAKSEFMNIVSHELRTPMTSIKGSLGLISSERLGPIPEKMKSLVNIAEEETNRLVRLINDFLDLAKIEAKNYSISRTWTPINQILEKAQLSLKGLSEKASVPIEIQNHTEDLEIFVDNDKIQQVIVNLLSNAIKYSPEGRPVEIHTRISDHRFLLEIRDHGPGIEEQHLEPIFQKFRQANSPDRPLVKGTGLGLSIAKSLVEAHDGEIGVTSEYGHGSCFYFYLSEYRNINNEKLETAA